MSTRVQKGGPIFRPVAKPRARLGSEALQSSPAADSRSSVGPGTPSRLRHGSVQPLASAEDASSSMPPPTLIPQKPPQTPSGHNTVPTPVDSPKADNERHAFTIATPTRASARPPPILSSSAAPTDSEPPRASPGTAIPISTPSRDPSSRKIAVPASPALPVIASSSSAQISPISTLNPSPNTAPVHHAEPVNDSQIDPALIKAVVTALQHTEGTQDERTSLQHVENQVASDASHLTQTGTGIVSETPLEVPVTTVAQEKGKRGPPRKSARQAQKSRATVEDGSNSSPDAAGEEEDSDTHAPKKRKRNPATTPRKRRSRAPSLPAYDVQADPGEELDPTAVTMAELCEDTGRGRVSSKAALIMSNHAAWRSANREKRALMRARMESKKYGRDPDEEDGPGDTPVKGSGEGDGNEQEANPLEAAEATSRAQSAQPEGRNKDFDYTQAMSTSRYNVQVRIGPNGETIIDETSLVVDRHEEEDTAEYTHIEESDTTKFVNSATYSKKLRGSRWSAEETDLFYDALMQFGENYELISLILPGRDRKACKNKFKAEDKRNPGRITYCLKNRRPYDIETLSRITGKDFSGPTPEIRAPTPLRMPESTDTPQTDHEAQPTSSLKPKEDVQTPPVVQDVEILGNIEELSESKEE